MKEIQKDVGRRAVRLNPFIGRKHGIMIRLKDAENLKTKKADGGKIKDRGDRNGLEGQEGPGGA